MYSIFAKKCLKYIVVGVLTLFITTPVYAVTMDNDGSIRENPYGDSKLPNSYSNTEYYDCYLPYQNTFSEIGGYATGVLAYDKAAYNTGGMSSSSLNNKVGTIVNYEGGANILNIKGGLSGRSGFSYEYEDETGLILGKDNLGNQYYLTAVQKFFYSNSAALEGGFPGFNSTQAMGQLFDVILTDGTVIHFAFADGNAEVHTNGGDAWIKYLQDHGKGKGWFDVKYSFAQLNYPQYRYLFHAQVGHTLELLGKTGKCVSKFKNKYNIGNNEGQNQIAYYRMYNAHIFDAPNRVVGSEVSYNLGEVTISSSSSQGTGEHLDSKGNKIVSEYELEGMQGKDKHLSDKTSDIVLPTPGMLSINQEYSRSVTGENIKLQKEYKRIDNFRVFVVFIGMFLIMYTVILSVCALFDRFNGFFEISLVRLVSFGLINYMPYIDRSEADENNGVSSVRLITIIVIIDIIGVLLISGGLLPAMFKIIHWVVSLFK